MALLIEDDPRHRRLTPDGDPADLPSTQPAGTSISEAIRSREFVGLDPLLGDMTGFLGFLLCMSETELQGVQDRQAALRSTTLTLSVGNRTTETVDAAEVVLMSKEPVSPRWGRLGAEPHR
jgi:hypothetical protein